MGQKIFINYRRELSGWHALALYRELIKHFDRENIFKDFNTIQPGDDFVEKIEYALDSCDILLVLINKEWGELKDAKGNNRLNNIDDFVRIEIATALNRKITVIPVLFDGAPMPSADSLPEDLKKLSRRQSIEIDKNRFEEDTVKLVDRIKYILTPPVKLAVSPSPIIKPAAKNDPSPVLPGIKPGNRDKQTPFLQKNGLIITAIAAVIVALFFILPKISSHNNKATDTKQLADPTISPVDSSKSPGIIVDKNTGKAKTDQPIQEPANGIKKKSSKTNNQSLAGSTESHIQYNSFQAAYLAAFADAKNNFSNLKGDKINNTQPIYWTKMELHDRSYGNGTFDVGNITEGESEWVFDFNCHGDKDKELESFNKIDNVIQGGFSRPTPMRFEKQQFAPRSDMKESYRYLAPPYRVEVLRMLPTPGSEFSIQILIYHKK